jgi:putative colanic acid biosynthesis UDP-glucose lipid carrier transferase
MKRKKSFYHILRYALDAFSIMVAILLLKGLGSLPIGRHLLLLFFLILSIGIWYLSSISSRLYAERRSNKFSEEIIFIVYHTIVFSILLSALLYFLQPLISLPFSRYLLCIGLVFLLTTITKYIHRKYIHSILSQGKLYNNILLVGANTSAEFFYETVNKYYYYGYKCVGFLDNSVTILNGCNYWGTLNALDTVLARENINEVVITLPGEEQESIRKCIEICESRKMQARILPDAQKYASTSVEVGNIGIMPVLNISELPLDKPENRLLKRSFDVAFSLLFFTTAGLLLMPLIALLIKLTSRGPVLFRQERWGLNNAKIICYKFRTMVQESSEVDEQGRYRSTTKDDPRITPIGRFLRKTNLDELPQFWNVLIGNMSIVGPRPHPTPMNLESMQTVENYMLRHIILPGITGWAQVNGLRGEIRSLREMQQRVDFDLYYIHRWTFWLDSQIILQTVINFLRGDQNAY